jgi:hypothetical protein
MRGVRDNTRPFQGRNRGKRMGGISKVQEKQRGRGNKPGYTFFVGLLEDNFFQPKKEKTEAALQLTERNVRPIRS